MTDRTALVIGAHGFVGSNTVRALLAAGWNVHCFGPSMQQDLLSDVRDRLNDIKGSVEDTDAMSAAMTASGADVVITLAAFSAGSGGLTRSGDIDADRAFDINVSGLRHTFDAALDTGIARVVWSSSTTLYGPTSFYPDQPIDETAPARPQTVYGLTKATAEQVSDYYRDRHGLDAVAVRLPLVFGPGLWYQGAATSLLAMFEAAAQNRSHVLAGPSDPVDLMYVPDTAEALVAIAGHGSALPGRLNINGFTARFAELAEAVRRAVPGLNLSIQERVSPIVYPLISTRLIESELGYRPRYGLDQAVTHFIERIRST